MKRLITITGILFLFLLELCFCKQKDNRIFESGSKLFAADTVKHTVDTIRFHKKNLDQDGCETVFRPDIFPKFTGSKDTTDESFMQYVVNKFNNTYSIKKQVSGTVYVSFTVTCKGKMKDASIAKGLDKDVETALITVIQGSPEWIPGILHNQKVSVAYTAPFIIVQRGELAKLALKK